jgi:nicotinamide-nucleotide amidase
VDLAQPDRARPNRDPSDDAASIARALKRSSQTVAVAESLTSGSIASSLGAAEDASEWFRGGVIAYASEVKFDVLGVRPGPVVTAGCARQMASGVAALTGADFALAVTGVGGPEPEEGKPVGTVFIAVRSPDGDRVEECHFDGGPAEIVHATTARGLRMLAAAVQETCEASA